MRTLNYLLALLFLNGCVLTPGNQKVELQLGVEYIDADYNKIIRNDLPKEVLISFPVIPGAVAGNILTEGQLTRIVDVGSKLTIDIEQLTKNVKPYATPLLATEFNLGSTMIPKKTKLLRTGTFAFDPSSEEFLGPTGIHLPNSDVHQLFLVYFDRPASLTGSYYEGESLVEYDVDINIGGLSWLKVIILESGILKVTKHEFTGNEIISIQAPQKNNIKT